MNIKHFLSFFIAPILVGVLITGFEFYINKEDIEISYFEKRHRTASPVLENGVAKILENDLTKLSVSEIQLRNTGDRAIKNLSLEIRFKEVSSDFELLNLYHITEPEYQFGNINQQIEKDFILLDYEILNINNLSKLQISLEGDYEYVTVYSKFENLNIKDSKYFFEPYKQLKYCVYFVLITMIILISLQRYLQKNQRNSGKN